MDFEWKHRARRPTRAAVTSRLRQVVIERPSASGSTSMNDRLRRAARPGDSAICLSLADRDKLPHADLLRALAARIQFRVGITKHVNTDSNPTHRALSATQRAYGRSLRRSSVNVQCSDQRPACTSGVNAPRTALLPELMLHESSRPFLSRPRRGTRRCRSNLVHGASS